MITGAIELSGLHFVDCMSTKLTSNKASICQVAGHGGVIKDMSLKTGWWCSKIKAYHALKLSQHYATELVARLAGKRNKKTSP